MIYTAGRCLIGDLLAKQGWTQMDLVRASNVPKSNLSDYVNDKHAIGIIDAKNVAEALGCSIEDLYEWVPVDPIAPDDDLADDDTDDTNI